MPLGKPRVSDALLCDMMRTIPVYMKFHCGWLHSFVRASVKANHLSIF